MKPHISLLFPRLLQGRKKVGYDKLTIWALRALDLSKLSNERGDHCDDFRIDCAESQ